MSNSPLHVVPHEEDGWALKREGKSKPESTHSTQKEAIEAAHDIAEDADGEQTVVIHRMNGQIRNVRTIDPSESESNGTNSDRSSSTESRGEPGTLSLGSRVRWGAVLAGATLTLTTGVLLGVLGIALALCLANVLSVDAMKVFLGVWACLALLGSLFAGGMIISRLTLGDRDALAPSLYGALLWGLMFVILPLLPLSSMDLGFGALDRNAVNDAVTMSQQELEKAGLEEDQKETALELQADAKAAIGLIDNNATEIAWLTFAAMLLSLVAAVGGAWVGASYPVVD